MTKIRTKGENIRKFILNQVDAHASDLTKFTATHFGLTRQAVNKHLQKLIKEKILIESGNTKNRTYQLAPQEEWQKIYKIVPGLAEDIIWKDDIKPALGAMADNVLNIWQHGFTEMFNNAIDHAKGSHIHVQIKKTATYTEMLLEDDGIGIFKNIQTIFNLLDERHALLELSKGKLTTNPKQHSGEGIFFTSRMFDWYGILSGGVYFSHQFEHEEDWILENHSFKKGTLVWMKLYNHTARTTKKVFDQYTDDESFGFNKTVVPVKLAQYGNDKLISRSQAKRLLARMELFKIVIFDFSNVDTIGQAFADEIFRVFANEHPEIKIETAHTNVEINQVIARAKARANTN